MARVGNQICKVVDLIKKETPSCLPPLASNGCLPKGLDPKLRVVGLVMDGNNDCPANPLQLPLCPKALDAIILNKDRTNCQHALFGTANGYRLLDRSKR